MMKAVQSIDRTEKQLQRQRIEPEPRLLFSISLYLNAFAELEDALRWTLGMLRQTRNDQPLDEIAGGNQLTDYCMAVRHLLNQLPSDKRPSTPIIDDTLRQCLLTQAVCERVVTGSRVLNNSTDRRTPHGLPRSDDLRRQAGAMIGLAMKVLKLHALFHGNAGNLAQHGTG